MTLEFAGNVLCSAGVSYFHVYPNGDVYRCLAETMPAGGRCST